MYPLEWFDSLIINSFDTDNSSVKVSEYELENLSKTIVSESKKIKIHIKDSFFELKSKRQIRLLIRKYHSSLVFLIDRVVGLSEVLRVLFEAAALCIDTLRTFQLVVLSILGPLVFGIAVFDGFQHTLTVWLARYINIYLWLPVANIFGSIIGKIQELMLKLDLSQVQATGDTFFSSTDMSYLIFMIIGIIGYFTVPSVANYIVHAGGGGALGHKVTSMFGNSASSVMRTSSNAVGMAADAMGDADRRMTSSMAATAGSSPYFTDKGNYMNDRLKGNSNQT